MTLSFKESSHASLGVEIELQILDSDLNLTPRSSEIVKLALKRGVTRIKREIHQSMIEVDTEISDNVQDCRMYLEKRLKEICLVGNELGVKFSALATHPLQHWKDRLISRQKRYEEVHDRYQWLARRMNVYGMHVHVGVKSGDHALAIINRLVKITPLLLALSANSPFWQGIDTGVDSSRINVMESFPYGGTPPLFSDWKQFEHYYNTLLKTGVITSLKDLYWHIRPNVQFGTIEFRVCDTLSNVDEIMAIVSLIQCLVVRASNEFESTKIININPVELSWIAPENLWIAARDGLNGFLIADLDGNKKNISEWIEELVQELQPIATELKCKPQLNYIHKMLQDGNGATKQRKIFQNSKCLKTVIENSINELLAI